MAGILSHESFTGLDESLDVVKERQRDAELNALGEEAVFQAKVEDEQAAKVKVEENAESVLGDDAEVSEETSEEAEAVVTDGKQTTLAAEALRHDLETRMVTEDFKETVGKVGTFAGDVALDAGRFAVRAVLAAATVLRELGVKYGPGIIDKVGRTLTYIYSRSARLLLKTITSSIDTGRRQLRSFSSSQKKIQSLQETLSQLETSPSQDDAQKMAQKAVYSDLKGLSYFRVGSKISPSESLRVISAFMKDAITQIDQHVTQDLDNIQKLIQLAEGGVRGDLMSFMQVQPFSAQYLKEQLPGYRQDTTLIDNYVYGKSLPNGLLFAAALPKTNLKDIKDIGQAYQEAGVFLAVDSTLSPLRSETIDYMDKQELERFLTDLDELCRLAIQHASLYAKIAKKAEGLKFNYRHYYQSLIEAQERRSVRESLVEYVHLKQAFVTRVYVPAAMDVHDYVAAYVVRALSYAKENLNHLT